MKVLLLGLLYLHMLNAFVFNNNIVNRIRLNLTNDNVENERKIDIFDKFELYSRNKQKELQDLYLFKVQQYLAVKSDFDKYKQSLLYDDIDKQRECLLRIKKHVDIQIEVNKE